MKNKGTYNLKIALVLYIIFALFVGIMYLSRSEKTYTSNEIDTYELEGSYELLYSHVSEYDLSGTRRRDTSQIVYYPVYVGEILSMKHPYETVSVYLNSQQEAEEYGMQNPKLQVNVYTSINNNTKTSDVIVLRSNETLEEVLEEREVDDVFVNLLMIAFLIISLLFFSSICRSFVRNFKSSAQK